MAYASKYYDPVKAHEYYMKTRELKGYENRYGGSRGDGTSAASTPGYLSDAAKENGIARKGSSGSSSSSSNSSLNAKQEFNNLHNSAVNEQMSGLRDQMAQSTAQTKETIANLRLELENMSPEDRKANRDKIRDEIDFYRESLRQEKLAYNDKMQWLKQATKGGSTSGFNEKGKAAAAYIKKQMEEERDEIIKQSNKKADEEMLGDVRKLAADIKAMRESGRGFSHRQFASKINSMLGKTKKIKVKAKRQHIEDYKEKYKDEIDKLRLDDSMFSYWDTRAEREKQEQARRAEREKKRAEREKKRAEREQKRLEREQRKAARSGG